MIRDWFTNYNIANFIIFLSRTETVIYTCSSKKYFCLRTKERHIKKWVCLFHPSTTWMFSYYTYVWSGSGQPLCSNFPPLKTKSEPSESQTYGRELFRPGWTFGHIGKKYRQIASMVGSQLFWQFTTSATSRCFRPQGRCCTDLPLLPLSHSTWAAGTLKIVFLSITFVDIRPYEDHLVDQTIWRIWRADIQSSAPHNVVTRSLICP